jgi:hypothetical protein
MVSALVAAGTSGNIHTGAFANGIAESSCGRARAMETPVSLLAMWCSRR